MSQEPSITEDYSDVDGYFLLAERRKTEADGPIKNGGMTYERTYQQPYPGPCAGAHA